MVAISRSRFTVTVERGHGSWWVTECVELGAVSQVLCIDQAADDMREAIAHLSGLSVKSLGVV